MGITGLHCRTPDTLPDLVIYCIILKLYRCITDLLDYFYISICICLGNLCLIYTCISSASWTFGLCLSPSANVSNWMRLHNVDHPQSSQSRHVFTEVIDRFFFQILHASLFAGNNLVPQTLFWNNINFSYFMPF